MEDNSTSIPNQFWFIPTDILMITSSSLAALLAALSLSIILIDKTCRTVPMMLVANTCLIELLFATDMFALALFTLNNDLKQIRYQDALCVTRAILGYMTPLLQNFSFLIQAIYRYLAVVYPSRLFYQSAKFQGFMICLLWIFGLLYTVSVLVFGKIKYLDSDQICQQPLILCFVTIYNMLLIFVIPCSSTICVYFKLVLYARKMNRNSTAVNLLKRAKQELKMLRRIVILVFGVLCICLPKASVVFMGYFTPPPMYHFRIAFLFVHISLAFVMITIFKFTDQFQNFLMKTIRSRSTRVLPFS